MIWFFAFTALGVGISLFLMITHWFSRYSWRSWVGGVGALALFALLARN